MTDIARFVKSRNSDDWRICKMTDREKLVELIKRNPYANTPDSLADHLLAHGVIVLPCKVGDEVWGIRSYHGVKHPQQGRVDEMYFTSDMRLNIRVKHICIGNWGEKIFATREEAEAALRKEGQ